MSWLSSEASLKMRQRFGVATGAQQHLAQAHVGRQQIGLVLECLLVFLGRQVETESALQNPAAQEMALEIVRIIFCPAGTPAIAVVEETALQGADDQGLPDHLSLLRPSVEEAAQLLVDRLHQASLDRKSVV